jgi:hypothetical protein
MKGSFFGSVSEGRISGHWGQFSQERLSGNHSLVDQNKKGQSFARVNNLFTVYIQKK